MKNIRALIISTNSVIWLVVVATLAGEISKIFKSLLTALTGHHWVSKSLLSLVLFVVIYLAASRGKKGSEVKPGAVYSLVVSAALGAAVIFVFFLWHFWA